MADHTIYQMDLLAVPHWNVALHVAREDGGTVQWFPLRSLCAVLGVSWPSQSEVIKGQLRFEHATRIVTLKTDAGMRPMLCMKRPEVSFWLAGIDPRRIKPALRDHLEAFQAELMAAADKLLWPGAQHAPAPVDARGVLSSRQEITFACPECGSTHRIVIEDGVATVLRP